MGWMALLVLGRTQSFPENSREGCGLARNPRWTADSGGDEFYWLPLFLGSRWGSLQAPRGS